MALLIDEAAPGESSRRTREAIDTNYRHANLIVACHVGENVTETQTNLTIAPNGRVVIPATMRAAVGLAGGGKVVARVVDGAVILEPVDAAIRRAQALVGRYMRADAGLADELVAERHAAAGRE